MHSELPTSGLPTSRQSWGRQYKGSPPPPSPFPPQLTGQVLCSTERLAQQHRGIFKLPSQGQTRTSSSTRITSKSSISSTSSTSTSSTSSSSIGTAAQRNFKLPSPQGHTRTWTLCLRRTFCVDLGYRVEKYDTFVCQFSCWSQHNQNNIWEPSMVLWYLLPIYIAIDQPSTWSWQADNKFTKCLQFSLVADQCCAVFFAKF